MLCTRICCAESCYTRIFQRYFLYSISSRTDGKALFPTVFPPQYRETYPKHVLQLSSLGWKYAAVIPTVILLAETMPWSPAASGKHAWCLYVPHLKHTENRQLTRARNKAVSPGPKGLPLNRRCWSAPPPPRRPNLRTIFVLFLNDTTLKQR